MAKNRTMKLVLIGFGLAILASGAANFFAGLEQIPMAIILLFAGLILLGQVGIRQLINSRFEVDKDIPSAISLVLALVLVVSSGVIGFGWTVPEFFNPLITFGTVIAGIMIVVQALRN